MKFIFPEVHSGLTYFAWNLLCSYLDEHQKNEIYFLILYTHMHDFKNLASLCTWAGDTPHEVAC